METVTKRISLVVTLFLGSLPFLAGCQFANSKPFDSGLNSPEKLQEVSESNSENRAVEGSERELALSRLIAALNRQIELEDEGYNERVKRLIERKTVIQQLLEQPEKLASVVEACSNRESIWLADILRLAERDYILYFSCYTGAYQGGGTFFLFSETRGIQTEPLHLTELSVSESGEITEVEKASREDQAIPGYYNFDENSKQLRLVLRAGGQWDGYTSSKYSFEEERPVLQEYVAAVRSLSSKDNSYITKQYIRNQDGWILSGEKDCQGVIGFGEVEFDSCSNYRAISF